MFCSTLDNIDDWANSIRVRRPAADQIAELKQQPGKDIAVTGSPTLGSQTAGRGHARPAGPAHPSRGRRQRAQHLFADDAEMKRLRLIDAEPPSTGVVIARYQPLR